MKNSIITLPAVLTACLVLILFTIAMIQYTQTESDYMFEMSIDGSKVNLPGPNSNQTEETITDLSPNENEGRIVFLKEDFHEQTEESPTELTSYTENEWTEEENDLTEDEAFMREMTTSESILSSDGTDNYLVIAGTYTDDMVVLSKQAQYLNKGYSAEIIQFENNKAKNICMGRYNDVSEAENIANEIETKHDISTYVFHQAPQSR